MSQVDSTCTEEGTKTYTATATDSYGATYSDTKSETIDATGHKHSAGKVVDLGDGNTGIEYECEHCHEKFIISTNIDEND